VHITIFAFACSIFKFSENPTIQKLFERAKVFNGPVSQYLKVEARQKDRAMFVSTEICQAADSELSREKSLLYSKTGGCFGALEVKFSTLSVVLEIAQFFYRISNVNCVCFTGDPNYHLAWISFQAQIALPVISDDSGRITIEIDGC